MRLAICALVFGLTACGTPQVQPYQPSEHPAAHTLGKDMLIATDGAELPLKRWLPPGRPKAAIIALHGFNDYSNAFATTGAFFKKHGVAVYAYDQRGFGRAPQTGIWAGEQNLVGDLAECVRQVSRRWPGVPVYVLGESMGATVAIVAAADPSFPDIDGIILSAPAVWGNQTLNPFYRAPLWLVAHIAPSMRFTGRDLHILASNNIPMLRALSTDPLVIKETRADAIYGIVQMMDSAYDKVPAVDASVLMLYGGKDQVIPEGSVKEVRARLTAPMHYLYYPKGYHMLLRDLQGESVMQDILQWIEKGD